MPLQLVVQLVVAEQNRLGQHPMPPGQGAPGAPQVPPSRGPPSGQHCTGCPQLSMHVGLHPPLGVQHCPFGSQTWPDPQPHIIVPPHPLETVPQALPHETGEQHLPVGSQTSEEGHVGEHATICPQPLSTEMLQRPPHGFGFGVQHVPASASQMPPFAQRPLLPQVTR